MTAGRTSQPGERARRLDRLPRRRTLTEREQQDALDRALAVLTRAFTGWT